MTYRGKFKNGVVVFDGRPPFREGAAVLVGPAEAPEAAEAAPRPGSVEALRACDARWAGETSELDRLLDEVRADREADLTPLDDRP